KNLKDVVEGGLCLGCGLCALNPNENATEIKMNYSQQWGHAIPSSIDLTSQNAKAGFEICPGKGYKINSVAKNNGLGKHFHLDLGFYNKLTVVNGVSPIYRKNASSSGIMIAIAQHLIDSKMVDKAIVTKFVYGNQGVNTKTYATSNL